MDRLQLYIYWCCLLQWPILHTTDCKITACRCLLDKDTELREDSTLTADRSSAIGYWDLGSRTKPLNCCKKWHCLPWHMAQCPTGDHASFPTDAQVSGNNVLTFINFWQKNRWKLAFFNPLEGGHMTLILIDYSFWLQSRPCRTAHFWMTTQ